MPRNAEARAGKGAVAAEKLKQPFPPIRLPIHPPFAPMEARLVGAIPECEGWRYEPKWDGFRCLAFRQGGAVLLQSKAGQPLGRYFPELVEALAQLPQRQFALDGEIVIARDGRLAFDELLLRIHPAARRVRRLSAETPATYLVFDILADERGTALTGKPLHERRQDLKFFFKNVRSGRVRLSPATSKRSDAMRWMKELGAAGFDGVVVKRLDDPYRSGERAMEKIKRIRTADCVVGGFRWAQKGGEVGSLLLGLYDDRGLLDHVGFTSGFSREDRKALKPVVKPLAGGEGFTGHAPGGPSRWSTRRSDQWVRLKPKLVCEVQYDHFSGDRFRHGTRFLRWRPEKSPRQCTFEQALPKRRGGSRGFDFLAA